MICSALILVCDGCGISVMVPSRRLPDGQVEFPLGIQEGWILLPPDRVNCDACGKMVDRDLPGLVVGTGQSAPKKPDLRLVDG